MAPALVLGWQDEAQSQDQAGEERAEQIEAGVEGWPRCGGLGSGSEEVGEESRVTHRVLTGQGEQVEDEPESGI